MMSSWILSIFDTVKFGFLWGVWGSRWWIWWQWPIIESLTHISLFMSSWLPGLSVSNAVSLCHTDENVSSGKREITKKMSTNLVFGFYYSLCWQTSRDNQTSTFLNKSNQIFVHLNLLISEVLLSSWHSNDRRVLGLLSDLKCPEMFPCEEWEIRFAPITPLRHSIHGSFLLHIHSR